MNISNFVQKKLLRNQGGEESRRSLLRNRGRRNQDVTYLAVFPVQKDTHKPKMAQICQKYTKVVQKWSKSYSVLIPPPLGFLMDQNKWADRKLGLNSNLDL